MRITNLRVSVAAVLLSSCATPKIAYFQDIQPGTAEEVSSATEIRVRPEDKISILVNSKDPLLANLFNLPIVSRQIGTVSSASSSNSQGISGYTVNKEGDIDFPVLGPVHVAGMTREEIAAHIKHELISQDLVKDPVVTVEFMNLTVSVLGEVVHPGRFSIDKDRLTLLDAISMAGDLTVYGKRDNVLVQRDENGARPLRISGLLPATERHRIRRTQFRTGAAGHREREQRPFRVFLDVAGLAADNHHRINREIRK